MDFLLLRRLTTFGKILFPTWKCMNFLLAILVLALSLIGNFFLIDFKRLLKSLDIINKHVLDQVAIFYLGLLPSRFYVLLGKRDESAFERLIFMSILFVIFKALVNF